MKKLLNLLVLFSASVATSANADCPGAAKSTGVHVARIGYSSANNYLTFTIEEPTNANVGALTLIQNTSLDTDFGRGMVSLLLFAKSGHYPITFNCANGDVTDLSVDAPS